jgi:hypothetical protein
VLLRLPLPLEQVDDQHSQTSVQLALIALAHVFDFFRDVFDVELIEPFFAEQACGFARPEGEVLVIEACPCRFQGLYTHGAFQ